MDIRRQESRQISVLRLPFFLIMMVGYDGTPEQSYSYFAIKRPCYWGMIQFLRIFTILKDEIAALSVAFYS